MLNFIAGDEMQLGAYWARQSNSVVQLGFGASGAIMAEAEGGRPITFGWGGSFSSTLAFDPQGNVALTFSYGNGPTAGEGIMGGVQFSRSRNATSVFSLAGPSTSRGVGIADGYAASYDYSNNAGGTDTLMLGGGVGGIGAFKNQGPTTVIPLICASNQG